MAPPVKRCIRQRYYLMHWFRKHSFLPLSKNGNSNMLKIKSLYLTVCAFIISLQAFGQQPTFHRDAVSFSTGYSLSVGKTVNKLFEDSNGELAGDGFYARLNYEHKFL